MEKQPKEEETLRIDSKEWDFSFSWKDGVMHFGATNRKTKVGFYGEVMANAIMSNIIQHRIKEVQKRAKI